MTENLEGFIERKKKIETIVQKYIGSSFSELNNDITEKFSDSLEDIEYNINISQGYRKSKLEFTKRFIIKLMRKHNGNICHAAREAGVDRRTIHRLIKRFKIDMEYIRSHSLETNSKKINSNVYIFIEDSLKKYERKIDSLKFDIMYKNVPIMTRDIIDQLYFDIRLTLKEAEFEFEKKLIFSALSENKNRLSLTAKKLGIRPETLYRKIKKFKK